jgi:dihydroorotase
MKSQSHCRNWKEHEEAKLMLTRREALAGITGSLVAVAAPLEGKAVPSGTSRPDETAYDLLIRGGKVLDPLQNIEAQQDVAIREGRIVKVDTDIPPNLARQVLKAQDKIVTPGLIDLHVHVFPYVGSTGIEPDPYCVTRGATTVVDAGTSGALDVQALRHYVVERAQTRIRVLLNIAAQGLIAGLDPLHIGELEDLRYCDPRLAAKTVIENRDLIVGLKVRLGRTHTGPGTNDIEGMKRARLAADEARVPIMVHIGDSNSPLKDYLAFMKEGDIVTHVYNPKSNCIFDSSGNILPEVIEARKRGILFDLGPGKPSFSFALAEKCLAQNFMVDTISSDLNALTIRENPPNDLATAATRLLLLGMSLQEVIERMTINPARALNFGTAIGTLKPGSEADVAILELQDRDVIYTDGDNKTRKARQVLTPVITVRDGKVIDGHLG